MGVNATGTLGVAGRAQKTRKSRRRKRRGGGVWGVFFKFFISKWCDMVHSGCVIFKIHASHGLWLYDKLYRSTSLCRTNDTDWQIHSKFRWREKNKTLVKILGVVNTRRPLQAKYWGVATPATPAALTPMRMGRESRMLCRQVSYWCLNKLSTKIANNVCCDRLVLAHSGNFISHFYVR